MKPRTSLPMALLAAAFLTAAGPMARAEEAPTASNALDWMRARTGTLGASSRAMKESVQAAAAGPTAPSFVLPGLKGEVLALVSRAQAEQLASKLSAQPREQSRPLKRLDGKTVLIVFWAPWSKASADSLADVQALYERFGRKGLEVVAISLLSGLPPDKEQAAVLDAAAPADASGRRRWRYGYFFAMDDGFAAAPYGVQAIPAFVIVGPEGQVALQVRAFEREKIEAALQQLLP